MPDYITPSRTETLYARCGGPLLEWRDATLHVSDLNPSIDMRQRMSRWELLSLGLRCVACALLGDR